MAILNTVADMIVYTPLVIIGLTVLYGIYGKVESPILIRNMNISLQSDVKSLALAVI